MNLKKKKFLMMLLCSKHRKIEDSGVQPEPPEPLPYDSEIKYLESTGTQYINTGIKVSDITNVETRMAFTTMDATTEYEGCSANGRRIYFGKKKESDNNIYFCAGLIRINYTKLVLADSSFHSYSLGKGVYTCDDYIKDVTTASIPSTYTEKYCMFAPTISATGISNYCKMKKSSIKIYGSDDVLLFDAIPVRKDNVGYMYDKVSEQLFGNDGTGEFILGPDV